MLISLDNCELRRIVGGKASVQETFLQLDLKERAFNTFCHQSSLMATVSMVLVQACSAVLIANYRFSRFESALLNLFCAAATTTPIVLSCYTKYTDLEQYRAQISEQIRSGQLVMPG